MERDARRGMTTATLVLMGSTLASRVLGLLREALLAARLGTGSEADAYATAFLLPDLVNTLLAGGFLSLSFVPLYLDALRERGKETAARFLGGVALILGVSGAVAIALLAVYARPALHLLQPGLVGTPAMERAIHLTRILLPAQLCFLLAGAWNGAQYAHRRFLVPAIAPLVYNVGILAGGWILAPWMGAEGFAWGVLAGAVVGHLFLQAWGLWISKAGVAFPREVGPDLRAFVWRSLPLMLGLTLGFSSEFLLRRQAGFLGVGAVAQASYAFRLVMVLVALFGQSTGVASYPYMVDLVARREWGVLQELIRTSLRRLATVLVPVSCFAAAFAHDLVRLAFRRGRFGEDAVVVVASHMAVMVWCVFPWCVQIVLARALYARGKFWLGAAMGTVCVLAAWPAWSFFVQRWGRGGLGPGLVLLVGIQATVFAATWWRSPSGKQAFAGFWILLAEIALVSGSGAAIGRMLGGGLFGLERIALVVASASAVAAWAFWREWPGVVSMTSRLRTRFGAS
ncbi:MAG TPA: lipid II flippase MurJ [Fibrobacteria bacterium]|nr:lipid II flippase MurJ [Fibrobacteria bacterium]